MSEEEKKPASAAATDAGGEADVDDEEEDLEKLQAEIAKMEEEAARLAKESEELEKEKDGKGAGGAGSGGGDGASAAAAEQIKKDGNSVYVGQVDYLTKPEELLAHFEACGQVERVTIVCDKFTGRSKGFAYVEFQTEDAVELALKLDGSEFRGRNLQVTHKRVNDPNFFGGGGRGGGEAGAGAASAEAGATAGAAEAGGASGGGAAGGATGGAEGGAGAATTRTRCPLSPLNLMTAAREGYFYAYGGGGGGGGGGWGGATLVYTFEHVKLNLSARRPIRSVGQYPLSQSTTYFKSFPSTYRS